MTIVPQPSQSVCIIERLKSVTFFECPEKKEKPKFNVQEMSTDERKGLLQELINAEGKDF